MQESSKTVVLKIIESFNPNSILDCPSGNGWLAKKLNCEAHIDGLDLYESIQEGYRKTEKHDLNNGIPNTLPKYDCITCCEGIEHLGNPEFFFRTARCHLNQGGKIIITTPNIWYPEAKLQFLFKGFFPSFPCLVGKIKKGAHMHIMPLSFPQIYLYLKLNEFKDIKLHYEELSKPKHMYERFLAIPQKLYCLNKKKKAKSEEDKCFWEQCVSDPSLYGRHLIITAER